MGSPVDINIILNELGCIDGSFVPVANEENKILIAAIAELEQRKERGEFQLQGFGRKLDSLKVHYDHAKQEIGQNLKLLNVQKHQLDTENHELGVAQNERTSYEKTASTTEKELEEQEKLNFEAMNKIDKLNQIVEKYSKKIEWARTMFGEFQEAIQRGDEANKILERFTKADSSRAEELESKRKLLQTSIMKQRSILIANNEQKQSLENVLNRTAQLYRKAHDDRQSLITVWKDSIAQMVDREREIMDTERSLKEAKSVSEQREHKLVDLIGKHEQQMTNGRELELQIEEFNEKISSERNKLNQLNNSISLKSGELEVLKTNLVQISKELIAQRQKNRQFSAEKVTSDKNLEEWKQVYESLKQRYESFKGKSFNLQDRLRELDQLIEIEEKNVKILTTENSRLSGAMFKAQQHLTELYHEERSLDSDVTSIENGLKKMRSIYKKNDQELRRQTLILYNIDFDILQTQQRIDRTQGKTFDVDDNALDRLIELERVYGQKKKSFHSLQSDISFIEEDLKKLNNYFHQDQEDLDKLRGVLKEKILLCESGEKKIQMHILSNQEKLVEENFLKIKVRQLEKMLRNQKEKILNMDRFKADVEKAVGQRLKELKAQSQVLNEKKKHLNEFRQKLKQELSERSVKLDVLKKRYDLVVDLLTRDDQGEVLTGTQIKIKAAQDKQFLLEKGNDLNSKVLQAEADIKAMENTLRVVNYSNDTYRRNALHNGQDNSQVSKELEVVKDKYLVAVSKLKNLQTNMIIKSEQLDVLNTRLDEHTDLLNRTNKVTLDDNDFLVKIHKDLLEQKLKHQRAEREMKIAHKKVKQKISDKEFMELLERDMLAKELQEQNTAVLQQLADLVDANPDMMGCVAQHLYEKGLSMPMGSRTKSQISWRSETSNMGHTGKTPKGEILLSPKSLDGGTSTAVTQQPAVIMIDFPVSGPSGLGSKLSKADKERIYRKSGGVVKG